MAERVHADGGLSFNELIGELRDIAAAFPDKRTGRNSRYAMAVVALAAFSVFWTQSTSFLAHQTAMQQTKGRNDADTLFGLTEIPTNNHIRDLHQSVRRPRPPARRLAVLITGLAYARPRRLD